MLSREQDCNKLLGVIGDERVDIQAAVILVKVFLPLVFDAFTFYDILKD